MAARHATGQPDPSHRSIAAVDIEGFNGPDRGDPDRLQLRAALDGALTAALTTAGIRPDQYDASDLGDGRLLVFHPEVSKALLLGVFAHRLAALLTEHNWRADQATRMRLRLVVHAGELLQDRLGWTGEALNVSFRMLDAAPVRAALRASDAPLALVVADDLYRQVVRHRHRGLDPAAFSPAEIAEKETRLRAWVSLLLPAPPAAAAGADGATPVPPPWPPPGLPPLRPAQLPYDVVSFVGRTDDRERLLAAIRAGAAADAWSGGVVIAAIDGKPGVGKSALALHAAHQVADAFPDGQLYVDLQGSSVASLEPLDPAEVLGRFLRALDGPASPPPASLGEAAARFRSLMAGRRMLIVLDNARDAAQVRPLLPATGASAVVVTSRPILAGLDVACRVSLEVLPEADAVELLGRVAGVSRVRGETAAAERVARLCGYLPLALRIAAARLAGQPALPLAALADRLDDERHRLDELSHDDLDLGASLEVSYRALDHPRTPRHAAPTVTPARAFRLVGLLPGRDFGAPAVAALLGLPERTAAAALERLVVAQLVEQPAAGRYRLHDLLRLYARRRADQDEPAADAGSARIRALDWYLDRARQAAAMLAPDRSPDAPRDRAATGRFQTRSEALAWLDEERKNLVAAAAQAAADGPVPRSWELAQTLSGHLSVRHYLTDWERISETALAAAFMAGNQPAEAAALRDLGRVAVRRAQHGVAVDRLRRSLAISERLQDRHGAGVTLNDLSAAFRAQRRFDEAARDAGRSLELHRALGDEHGQATALDSLGVIARQRRAFDQAAEHLRAAMALFAKASNRQAQARTLRHLGDLARHRDELAGAAASYSEALLTFREVGDGWGEAITRCSLGRTWLRQGRTAAAVEQLELSLRMRREVGEGYGQADDAVGDRHGEGVTRYSLGEAYQAMGELDAAVGHYKAALVIQREVGHLHGEGVTLHGLGRAYSAMGRPDDAIGCYKASHAILLATADPHLAAESLAALALAEAASHTAGLPREDLDLPGRSGAGRDAASEQR